MLQYKVLQFSYILKYIRLSISLIHRLTGTELKFIKLVI